jgi:hypothetical protein
MEGTDRLSVSDAATGHNLVRSHYRNQHAGIPVINSSTYGCEYESRYEFDGDNKQDPSIAKIQSVNSHDKKY